MEGRPKSSDLTAAEFFAGIGLVRMGLERAGFRVVWANDIEPVKHAVYASNFGDRDGTDETFALKDVWSVSADEVPDVALATVSFPCTDLSLAGWRDGLAGTQSSAVWGFFKVLKGMAERSPSVVMLENVVGLATSHGGRDLRALVEALNGLGYSADVFSIDAARFVPQSRPRLFVVGCKTPPQVASKTHGVDWMRPSPVERFLAANADLRFHRVHLSEPDAGGHRLADVVERFPGTSPKWWSSERVKKFADSLAPVQAERLEGLRRARKLTWRTAYRRTRDGVATWEIRRDEIAGCLRTARGGSSKQALVEAGRGAIRVRWMTPREYARLMGADFIELDAVTENQALFGLGDAVCVPAISWIGRNYLRPAIEGSWSEEICLAVG